MQSIFTFERPERTYYEVLGCDRSSTIEQIAAEYKVRARQLHPDKNIESSEGTDEQFKLLQEAKEVLLDEAKKAAYDKWLSCGVAMPFQKWYNLSQSGVAFHWVNSPANARLKIESSEPTKSPANWQREETADEMLRKFRNYEI